MRTTIDLPEELLRRAKATAALRGVKMKDLIAEFVRSGLSGKTGNDEFIAGMHCPIPVTVPANGSVIAALSNAEIEAILLEEDIEKAGLA